MSSWLYLALVLLVALERLVELRIASRNAKHAFSRGGVELGQIHYRVMVVLHSLFLISAPLEVFLLDRTFVAWLGWPMLALVGGTMALRYWIVHTLGERWNTRIIVIPGDEPTRRGPYRWLRHPNYVGVVVELMALPLVHSAWLTAVVFGLANAALLRVRIKAEEQALREHTTWARTMEGR